MPSRQTSFLALALLLVAAGAVGRDLDEMEARGKEIFLHTWTADDPFAHGGDGLGPSYNASSCVACHAQGGAGGSGGRHVNVTIVDGRVKHKHNALPPPPPPPTPAELMSAATVEVGAADIKGGLDAALVRRVMQLSLAQLRQCYQRELTASPRLTGKVSLRVTVDGTGRVTDARVASGSLNKTADACMTLRLRTWRFPVSATGATSVVTQPLVFRTNAAARARVPSSSSSSLLGAFRGVGGQIGLGGLSTRAAPASVVVERNTTALFGAGVIESIPDEVIEAGAYTSIAGHKEISGKVGRTKEGRVTRFGWKGDVPDLVTFVSRACSVEVGLEVPGSPQPGPRRTLPELDLNLDDLEALIAFVRSLPQPVESFDSPASHEGAELFDSIGCTSCHKAALGDVDGIYSDLLLHDMGAGLDDNQSTGYYGSPPVAGSREWRTPPLWGVRDSGPWLHDGRASTLESAIAKHGGESGKVMQSWWALEKSERAAVVAFLESLNAPSF